MPVRRERLEPQAAVGRLRELAAWLLEAPSLWKVAVWTTRWTGKSFEIVVKGSAIPHPFEKESQDEAS